MLSNNYTTRLGFTKDTKTQFAPSIFFLCERKKIYIYLNVTMLQESQGVCYHFCNINGFNCLSQINGFWCVKDVGRMRTQMYFCAQI